MMWFDKNNPGALFGDNRHERHILGDGRALHIEPNVQLDFTNLPFVDNSFKLVAFDPPHLTRAGATSWLRAKYGVLGKEWKADLEKGFSECFRVLESGGILVFKWNETHVKIKEVLTLTPLKPLFGHPTGRKGITHWYVFMKP